MPEDFCHKCGYQVETFRTGWTLCAYCGHLVPPNCGDTPVSKPRWRDLLCISRPGVGMPLQDILIRVKPPRHDSDLLDDLEVSYTLLAIPTSGQFEEYITSTNFHSGQWHKYSASHPVSYIRGTWQYHPSSCQSFGPTSKQLSSIPIRLCPSHCSLPGRLAGVGRLGTWFN